ncbi:4'-phosphopantetheinyl transferase family protein [Flavobacterium sp.]|uniref:4'-phosphopantetheinyl transferase family protein n=1 Tax=Flavobacterium sp. TaxID=239 RepID=UPI003D6C50AC
MVHIFYAYINEDNHEKLMTDFLPKLPITFQDKIRKYRRWQDAQLSILGRFLLIEGIKKTYDRDCMVSVIQYTKYKKPYFDGYPFKFNISHSGEMVVCALCKEFEIGIDVELISDIKIEDFKLQMTESEWNTIAISNDKRDAFFNYWTQKEAALKANSLGLMLPLKSFEILQNQTKINGEKIFLKEIKIDKKYKCHVSLKKEITDVHLNKLI